VDHTAEGEEADRGGRDETVERVNDREVYVWAAIDVDTGELPAIKASCRMIQSRSSMDALLFLSRALEARTNAVLPIYIIIIK